MGSAATISTLVCVIVVSLAGVFSAAIDTNLVQGGSQYWPQHSQPIIKRNAPIQLCGSRLVEAVRNLCKGGFFTGYHRRSDPAVTGGLNDESIQELGVGNGMDDSLSMAQYLGSSVSSSNSLDSYWDKDTENSLNDLELFWPNNPKSLALKVLTETKGHQRFRRNIIDECCKKSCSYSVMAKYCRGN